MTRSIVARDPDRGALRVAVESCFLSGGATVPWGEYRARPLSPDTWDDFTRLAETPWRLEWVLVCA
jgi:hypothetical protein